MTYLIQIMEREMKNDKFTFLFQVQAPEHMYYRWRVYSLSQVTSIPLSSHALFCRLCLHMYYRWRVYSLSQVTSISFHDFLLHPTYPIHRHTPCCIFTSHTHRHKPLLHFQGDTLDTWRLEPFQMVFGGPFWVI